MRTADGWQDDYKMLKDLATGRTFWAFVWLSRLDTISGC